MAAKTSWHIVRWTGAFLRERRQRVKIGDALSDWLQMPTGMPQGSHLGPLTFVILIDALQPGCLTHKYVDDTAVTEFLSRSAVSSMQSLVDELVHQATDTGMIVNGRKTRDADRTGSQGPTAICQSERCARGSRHSVQAAGSACCERPKVVASRRCYYIKGCQSATALSQADETFWRRAGRLAVFLRHRDPTCPGVCLPGVAYKSYCCLDEGIRVAAA